MPGQRAGVGIRVQNCLPKTKLAAMRALILILALMLPAASYGQKAPTVDIVQLVIGKPFPVPLLMEPKSTDASLPFYSVTVPMPESSLFKAFVEYDVDVMFDTKNIYVLRAKRTLDSNDTCRRALKSLVGPLTSTYGVKQTKSEFSLFEATAEDVEVQAYCGFVGGSPYPTLSLYISSKSERKRVSQLLRKQYGR